jgi:hypothetical protein
VDDGLNHAECGEATKGDLKRVKETPLTIRVRTETTKNRNGLGLVFCTRRRLGPPLARAIPTGLPVGINLGPAARELIVYNCV